MKTHILWFWYVSEERVVVYMQIIPIDFPDNDDDDDESVMDNEAPIYRIKKNHIESCGMLVENFMQSCSSVKMISVDVAVSSLFVWRVNGTSFC